MPPSKDRLSVGTWGGSNVGVIVDSAGAHVHVGCTNGDFKMPVLLDAQGRFSVSGSYILRAFPVQVGPSLPAQFVGVVAGNKLTLTVTVNDTVEKKVVTLGPAEVRYARDPQMQVCPICRKPQHRDAAPSRH